MPAPLIEETIKSGLRRLYAEPGRHYHDLSHIEALLDLASAYRALLSDAEAVQAAIWFHDAIYDSRAADNEAQSAALAREWLSGRADAARIERIAAMIEATADHRLPALDDAAALTDAALFLDMDLAILGARQAAFDRYEEAVRQEYGWVGEDEWRRGRADVLERFLARPVIFHTATFQSRFEAAARDNLSRSLAALRG